MTDKQTPSPRPIPIQTAAPRPSAEDKAREKAALLAAAEAAPWRLQDLMRAPHRLGFFLAMLLLVLGSLWWALVQVDRFSSALQLQQTIPATLVHANVMVYGFMPLYFAGFLFTAGPKWLNVTAPTSEQVRPLLLLQAGGWLLWLVGAQLNQTLALVGGALALIGLCWMYAMWWKLVRISVHQDRLHAKSVGIGGLIGCIALAGALLALWQGDAAQSRLWTLTGLWGYIVVTFVAVAHRMIPFFTSNAVPMVQVWRPFWVLGLMLGAALFEAIVPWLEALGLRGQGWMLFRGVVELGIAAMLLWLAVVWGLVQSLKIRLLAMLHIGFIWLGLAFLISGLTQILGASAGIVLPWAALHALTMGCLGSLIVAMVTRVSCGHSGRALIADDTVWRLFWLLQLSILLRIAGAFPSGQASLLLMLAALLWTSILAVWAWRYSLWYGKPRADGKEG